jgi:uncharacterized protein YbcI
MVATTEQPRDGQRAAAISSAISGLHSEFYGRGAERTRTVMDGDYVVCFLEDVYTPVERTLIDAGRFPEVRTQRQAFQQTMRGKFTNAVEELTGREVVAFLSESHVDPDLSVETFILRPTTATAG